jgi:signal-transduction protein with cAMP-binding, CBS, and nucleotidyltransferase domain
LIQWRQRLSISHHQEGAIDYLTLLGDAALVAGDRALAEAMLQEVAQGTERLRSSVMALARHASLLPVALGFWGHLKTERSGEHRGEYNVAAHALGPLIASLRAYAMLRGISDRSSIARIRRLQEQGAFTVDLANRLLDAFHKLYQLKIGLQLSHASSDERYVTHHELGEEGERLLKGSLEQVVTLQKMLYAAVEV